MFTGLIEDVGEVSSWRLSNGAGKLVVKTSLALRKIPKGASVAVNGTCLTIVDKTKGHLTMDISPETIKRTTFGVIRIGDQVNLECPLRLNGILGGHLVTGHVDGIAVIKKIKKDGDFTFFLFQISSRLHRFLVPKGSIAIDGISLTVNSCRKQLFSVAIIPFTLKNTNLHGCRVGDKVNIETDLIGKYVQRLLNVTGSNRSKTSINKKTAKN